MIFTILGDSCHELSRAVECLDRGETFIFRHDTETRCFRSQDATDRQTLNFMHLIVIAVSSKITFLVPLAILLSDNIKINSDG